MSPPPDREAARGAAAPDRPRPLGLPTRRAAPTYGANAFRSFSAFDLDRSIS